MLHSQHVRMPDVDDHPVCFMNVYDKLDKTNRTMVISTWKRTKSCQVLHLNVLQPIRGPHSSRGWERKNILRRRGARNVSISLSLSLWHLSVLQINPTQRVSCNTLYTPTRIIQKKKWFLLRTPKWLSQKKNHFKPSRFTDFAAAVLVDDMLRSWGISGWKMREGFLKKAAAKTMSRCLKKRLAP